jgi:hypothetical protein
MQAVRSEPSKSHGLTSAQFDSGNLICKSAITDAIMTCDECLGRGEYEGLPAISIGPQEQSYDGDAICYHADGGNAAVPGRVTACPGDPAPKKMPDDSETGFEGIVVCQSHSNSQPVQLPS